MKNLSVMTGATLLGLALAMPTLAEEKPVPAPVGPTAAAQPGTGGQAPAMSEIPTMKEQGERMATLMERLTRETDPAERKRIMAEAVCPQ